MSNGTSNSIVDESAAREKFVTWLSEKMTIAGRGDDKTTLDVEPRGKFWLGRLASEEWVISSGLGERGERLEPCAVGMRVLPNDAGPWSFNVTASMKVWIKSETGLWNKSPAVEVCIPVNYDPTLDFSTFGQAELTSALDNTLGISGLSAVIRIDLDRHENRPDELSICLVNTSPEEHVSFADTRLYECSIRVSDLQLQPFILEALPDSFRYDRRVIAYGINCGIREIGSADLITLDAIEVDRARPNFWSANTAAPDMTFVTLADDPIGSATELLNTLEHWGGDYWSESTLDARATSEHWTAEMRLQATEAATEFAVECNRIRHGIELLRTDPVLLRAFKLMNKAMSYASRGKGYGEWRPFQFGFLLSNIAAIVDTKKDAEIVDVVWFATGGGKTETYLGLLITAALHDRLTGKTSGVTAWSRFPLRMLSLQQTQRFANALAGAELVRREENIGGDCFSLGFFVGQGATPNKIKLDPEPGEPDPDDDSMPNRYRVLDDCPFCGQASIQMEFDRRAWRLSHKCGNEACPWPEPALPFYIVDEEIYRFLPTVIVGTLDKAASISIQASMRGLVGAPHGLCSKTGHGYTYAPRSDRPHGCLVPACKHKPNPLPMDANRYAPTFRLQDELHLLRDSLGAVDSHYEALYDSLVEDFGGRKTKILASSATLTGYERQIDTLYRRDARVFPVPGPAAGIGFWSSDSAHLMRRFVAIAPRGVTIEYTVDRLLSELQTCVRRLCKQPESVCAEIGVDSRFADHLISLYGTNVVYGNSLRDLEAVSRSTETQLLVDGKVNTASLTGKTDFSEVRTILNDLQNPQMDFEDRLHVISASSMMSHGVDVDRLNVMIMLGLPLSAAEFIQATARVGRKFPGLVFVVHKIGRERDASVFRSFPQFVEQGDRFIEPIPITRRSRRVLERTIAGIALARILMIHEPNAPNALTTISKLRDFLDSGGINFKTELEEIVAALGFEQSIDEKLRADIQNWFVDFRDQIANPPADARFLSDVSPTGAPMMSLRDVEVQVPIVGSRIK